jgi:hypothetical protein
MRDLERCGGSESLDLQASKETDVVIPLLST